MPSTGFSLQPSHFIAKRFRKQSFGFHDMQVHSSCFEIIRKTSSTISHFNIFLIYNLANLVLTVLLRNALDIKEKEVQKILFLRTEIKNCP